MQNSLRSQFLTERHRSSDQSLQKTTIQINTYRMWRTNLGTTCIQVTEEVRCRRVWSTKGKVSSYRIHTTGTDPDKRQWSFQEAQRHTLVQDGCTSPWIRFRTERNSKLIQCNSIRWPIDWRWEKHGITASLGHFLYIKSSALIPTK